MSDNKTTVVIPTLLKAPKLLRINIDTLLKQKCNIHIIDNTSNNGCRPFSELSPNIKISYFPTNIGVNKAWNLGVVSSQTEFYLLLNDDCLVWDTCIETSEGIMSDNTIGIQTFRTLTQISSDIYLSVHKQQKSQPDLRNLGPGNEYHMLGWYIFGRVKQYEQIPSELRIFYGDNFIYQMARKKGFRTVVDHAHFLFHQVSSTVNSIFTSAQIDDLLNSEGLMYSSITDKYKLRGF